MRIRYGVGLIAAWAALAFATPARAEGDGTSEADQHFQHAVELMKADNCTEAVPEFLTSQALDPSAATLVNLATCHARLGRNATAWKTYKQAAALASTEKNEPLRERALQAMSILGPTLTKLQIVSNSPSRLSIRVNGEVIGEYDGLPIPLDAGENVVEAAAPGREPWRKNVTADDLGATIVIQVPDLRPIAPPPPPQPQLVAVGPEPPRDQASDRGMDLRLPAAVLGGAGIASMVVGTVFGLSAKGNYDDSQQYCAANRCTAPGVSLRDRAYDKATASTVTIGVGLVAVTAGVVLWLTSPSPRPTRSQHAAVAAPPILVSTENFLIGVEGRR